MSNSKFIRLEHDHLNCPEVMSLTHTHLRLYLLFLSEYNGYNNGKIFVTKAQAKKHGIGEDGLIDGRKVLVKVGLLALSRKGAKKGDYDHYFIPYFSTGLRPVQKDPTGPSPVSERQSTGPSPVETSSQPVAARSVRGSQPVSNGSTTGPSPAVNRSRPGSPINLLDQERTKRRIDQEKIDALGEDRPAIKPSGSSIGNQVGKETGNENYTLKSSSPAEVERVTQVEPAPLEASSARATPVTQVPPVPSISADDLLRSIATIIQGISFDTFSEDHRSRYRQKGQYSEELRRDYSDIGSRYQAYLEKRDTSTLTNDGSDEYHRLSHLMDQLDSGIKKRESPAIKCTPADVSGSDGDEDFTDWHQPIPASQAAPVPQVPDITWGDLVD